MSTLTKEEWLLSIKGLYENASNWDQAQIGCIYGIYKSNVERGGNPNSLFKKGNTVYTLPEESAVPHEVEVITPVAECSDFEGYIATKYLNIRGSAKSREKDFNLTLADIRRLLKRKTCHYTGLAIGLSVSGVHPLQLTFDRRDPTLGYVKGNVVVCSHAANQFKNKIEHEFGEIISRKDQLKMITKMFE
tara:strand:+ start:150 stop:719 length:570 start_codon:yes stop_codon:yes gene_type:complete